MANLIKLEIVTPDRNLLSEDVEYVGAPGVSGDFGVLHNHTPFLTALSIGSLFYKKDGRKYFVFVSGGFTEVTPTKVSVLAEVAEKAEEISLERARKAKERAEQRLQQERERIDYVRAKIALARAMQRMRVREEAASAGTISM